MEKDAIHERAGYLRDSVFSANDGIITTFAIVAGAAGASLSPQVVVVLGLVNLLADGISMSTGNYLGVKSEIEYEDVRGNHGYDGKLPRKHAVVTFFTFVIVGFVPLIPYVFNVGNQLIVSSIMVIATLFVVGATRSKITKKGVLRSGLEVLFVGGLAAIVAYAVGYFAEMYLL